MNEWKLLYCPEKDLSNEKGIDGLFVNGNYKQILNDLGFLLKEFKVQNTHSWEILAATLLHVYMQQNYTGPRKDWKILDGYTCASDAIKNLEMDGEFPYPHIDIPQYLLCSRDILMKKNGDDYVLDSVFAQVYRCRVLMVQQDLLNEKAETVYRVCDEIFQRLLKEWPDLGDIRGGEMKARLLVEYGHLLHDFYRPKEAQKAFKEAQEATGLKIHVTGAMGKRTKYQLKNVVQLICQASSESMEYEFEEVSKKLVPTTLDEDSMMLETPEIEALVKEQPLRSVDQTILLAMCVNVGNSNPFHGLTTEQMFPYVTRCFKEPRNWMIFTSVLLQRSRLESESHKFIERSILQLEELIKQFQDDNEEANVAERFRYMFSVRFPPMFKLRQELADRYFKFGALRTAHDYFVELKLWEKVVQCLYAMDKPKKAKEVVEKCLQEEPNSPIYWDLLGTVTNDPNHFEKAWELSNHRYAKSMRNLGNYHMNKQQFKESLDPYEKALKLNSMFPRTWFAYGCAALRCQEFSRALGAFTRAVQINTDDAESWTNISSCHLQNGNFEKAYVALHEALKHKNSSFQMWQNMLFICIKIQKYQEAIGVIRTLVHLQRKDKEIDLGSIAHIMKIWELIRKEDPEWAERIQKRFVEMWEDITNIMIQNPGIWELKARFHNILGEREKELKSRSAHIRSLKKYNWEHDEKVWDRLIAGLDEYLKLVLQNEKNDDEFAVTILNCATLCQTLITEKSERHMKGNDGWNILHEWIDRLKGILKS